jgi:hypothetical protein
MKKQEEEFTKNIIQNFKSKYGISANYVNKNNNNFIQYKYDIEVCKDGKTVAIIEAKKRFASNMPTTDSIIGSVIKAVYERKYRFYNDVQIFILFYINNDALIIKNDNESKNKYKNGVFLNLDALLIDNVGIEILHLNIEKDLESQIENLDKQLNQLLNLEQ